MPDFSVYSQDQLAAMHFLLSYLIPITPCSGKAKLQELLGLVVAQQTNPVPTQGA